MLNEIYNRPPELLDAEQRLQKALDHLAMVESGYETVLTDAAEADTVYETERAKAYLAAEGTEKAREAQAKVDTEKYLRKRNNTGAVKEFTRTKIKDAQDAVSAYQSLLSAQLRTNQRF